MNLIKCLFTCACLILCNHASSACTCVDADSVHNAFRKTNRVFHGKALSMKLVPFSATLRADKVANVREYLKGDKQKADLFDLDYIYEVEFEILEDFKGGRIGEKVIVYTAMQQVSCGYAFVKGRDYIVYASARSYMTSLFVPESAGVIEIEKEGTYWTSICTRTRTFSETEATGLKLLRKNSN